MFNWCDIYFQIEFAQFLHNRMGIMFFQFVEYDSKFLIQFKLDITIFICRVSVFSSDMTMISYINILIKINIIIVLKISIIFFSNCKLFAKMIFHHITTVCAFLDHTIKKIANSIFTKVPLRRFTKFIISTYLLLTITVNNIFKVFSRLRLIWIILPIIFWHQNTFKICIDHKR